MAFVSLTDLVYPKGSYYLTYDSTFSPTTSFGGQWTKLDNGKMLRSYNSTTALTAASCSGNDNHWHNYGIGYRAFYGTCVGDDGYQLRIYDGKNKAIEDSTFANAGGAFKYALSSSGPLYGYSTASAKINNGLTTGTYSAGTVALYDMISFTSRQSNIPAYNNVIVWYRTA